MAARNGMADIIGDLRGMAVVGTADYTIAGSAYWSDDQLQVVLDRHRTDVKREPLESYPAYNNGTLEYKEFRSSYGNYESGTAGAGLFEVETAPGTAAGTANYTVDYRQGIITFTADQVGTAYYLNARSYNLNASAADVWTHKAAQSAQMYDFSTDNHNLKRSQYYDHCMKMADYYSGLAGPTSVQIYRDDCDV